MSASGCHMECSYHDPREYPHSVTNRSKLKGPPFLAFGPNSLRLVLIRPAKVISFPMYYLVKMHCFLAILVVSGAMNWVLPFTM
jgi:hypothetical protein